MQIKKAVYRSERGSGNKANLDGVLCLNRVPLFAVADGDGSAEAARTVLMALKKEAKSLTNRNAAVATNPNTGTRLNVGRFFELAFEQANSQVRDASQSAPRQLTSTIVAATISGPYAFVAHVGDSRAYLYRDGEARCLTNDHTLAYLQLQRGDITPAEYFNSPFRTTLSQALGVTPVLDVDTAEVRLMPRDVLVLATNGLHKVLNEEQVAGCLGRGDLDMMADRLISTALNAGAKDDVTVLLIEAIQDPDSVAKNIVNAQGHEEAARKTFLFKPLNDTEWLQLVPYLEQLSFQTGEILCRPNESGAFYAIAEGKVLLDRNSGETKELAAGEHFGTLPIATKVLQMETVTALEPVWVYSLSRARLHQFIRQHPALGGRIAMTLLERLGWGMSVLTERLTTILAAVHGDLGK